MDAVTFGPWISANTHPRVCFKRSIGSDLDLWIYRTDPYGYFVAVLTRRGKLPPAIGGLKARAHSETSTSFEVCAKRRATTWARTLLALVAGKEATP